METLIASDDVVLITGAGGFIGGHLTANLARAGFTNIRAVDRKPIGQWYQVVPGVDSRQGELSLLEEARKATDGARIVFNLAADMGGMGFIENNKTSCMMSVLTSTHVLQAAQEASVERYFYASSACVYAADKQTSSDIVALRESDAYPAQAEDGYGWEKLFSERMARHFAEEMGIETRVARYHNVYGPQGTFSGGREKVPAAICRKIAEAKLTGQHHVEIWGDGEQTRSFMYIDDCIEGTLKVMASGIDEPINLGSDELVSINSLVTLVEEIAGIEVDRHYNLHAPQGVRGRNSDNTLIREKLGWAPSINLIDGLTKTYSWVYEQVLAQASV